MRSWQRQIGCLNPANRFILTSLQETKGQLLTLLSEPLCIPRRHHCRAEKKAKKKAEISTFWGGRTAGTLSKRCRSHPKPAQPGDPADPRSLFMAQAFRIPASAGDAEPTPDIPLSFTKLFISCFFTPRQNISCFAARVFAKQLCLFPPGVKKKRIISVS